MNKINHLLKREEIELLKSLINKKLVSIKHDSFIYTNSSFVKVSFYFEDGSIFQLANRIVGVDDFFGEDEDVAKFTFQKCEEKDTETEFTGGNYPKIITSPINLKIKDIILINENVKTYEKKELTYEFDYVKGIIFRFEGIDYLFQRNIWFSEDIFIFKGANVMNKIVPVDEGWDDWGEGNHSDNTRNIISLINLDN